MATINTSIGPERVQVFDKPLGSVQLPGIPTAVTAFLISTSEAGAPVNTPVKVTDLSQFESNFGGPDEVANGAYYAIQGYFENAGTGNTAIIVNVGTSPSASDYIGNAADNSGLRALDGQDVLGLVTIPGLPLSEAYTVHSQLIDYTETVRAEFGATLSTSFSLIAVPKEISKADSETLAATDTFFVSASGSGPYTITLDDGSAGSVDLTGVTPGMLLRDASETFVATIVSVDDGNNTVDIDTDPASTFTAGDSVKLLLPSAVSYKEEVINNPSRTTAWYFNNANVLDRSSTANPGDITTVDPIGHVAGVIARIDANNAIGGPAHAPAGIRYAGIAGITGLNLALSERVDAAPLRLAFINRLQSFSGAGNVIFGGYTAAGSQLTAEEQLIQVMRTVQFIKASLEPGLRAFIWENFEASTQSQVKGAIESFLRNNSYLFPRGLPENQKFRVLTVEPTQDELDQGILIVRVQIKPKKAVRFIEVNLEFPIPNAA